MKNQFIISLVALLFLYSNAISQNKRDSNLVNGQEISLLFIGDFMCHQDQIDVAYNPATKTYSFDSCYNHITPMMSDADITIGNLETTLGIKPYSGYPKFSAPPSFAKAINNAGVDILSTVNNHSVDKFKSGMERTIHILDSMNIGHLGTYYSQEDKDSLSPLMIEKNGFKIALISYTYGTNSLDPIPPNIVNYLDSNTIANDVARARLQNPDVIIAYVHWGIQYKDYPSVSQKSWNTYFNSLGVKIVIGSHPHVVQPMKWDKKDSTIVVYSLGNFISHQRTFPRDGGAMVKVVLQKDSNQVSIKEANYCLSWVHETVIDSVKYYAVLPVKQFEKKPEFFGQKKEYDKMMRYVKHARDLLEANNENITEY